MAHGSTRTAPGVSLLFAVLFTLSASAQLIPRHDLSYSMALTIATGALDACKARGYPVAVVVVDRGGDAMVAIRADDAGPHTIENARRKAYTARTFKMTTEAFVKQLLSEGCASAENPLARSPCTSLL